MANEVKTRYITGATLYFVILNRAGQVYNGSTFEALNASNWGNYDIALTEQIGAGIYFGTFPAIAAGVYTVWIFVRAGGSPAITDADIAGGDFYWTGSAEAAASTESSLVEAGVTQIQALQRIGAVVAGKIANAGSGTETFKGMDGSTSRVQITVDADGNRSAITYDPA